MAQFAHNNAKNASTSHIFLELNYGFYPRISYKKDVNPRSQLKLVEKLVNKLDNNL